MSLVVLAWQLVIFFTIMMSGRKRGWLTAFWVIWTIAQVYTLPLSIIQFVTIYLGYKMAAPRRSPLSSAPQVPDPRAQAPQAPEPQSHASPERARDYPAIANCKFSFKCTQTWDGLTQIADSPGVRYCGECQAAVHLCTSNVDVVSHAKLGHCIAIRLSPAEEFVGEIGL